MGYQTVTPNLSTGQAGPLDQDKRPWMEQGAEGAKDQFLCLPSTVTGIKP